MYPHIKIDDCKFNQKLDIGTDGQGKSCPHTTIVEGHKNGVWVISLVFHLQTKIKYCMHLGMVVYHNLSFPS